MVGGISFNATSHDSDLVVAGISSHNSTFTLVSDCSNLVRCPCSRKCRPVNWPITMGTAHSTHLSYRAPWAIARASRSRSRTRPGTPSRKTSVSHRSDGPGVRRRWRCSSWIPAGHATAANAAWLSRPASAGRSARPAVHTGHGGSATTSTTLLSSARWSAAATRSTGVRGPAGTGIPSAERGDGSDGQPIPADERGRPTGRSGPSRVR